MFPESYLELVRSNAYISSATASSETISELVRDRLYRHNGKPDLVLSLCQLKRVPLDHIRALNGKLESIDLSYNYIRGLPSKFTLKLVTLTKLDLSKNELKKLPDNFGALEHLVYLDVHQNKLQTLPLSMGNMRRLQYLNITGNPFRPPLCHFLESEDLRANREVTGVDSAPIVIKFLAKLSQETYATGDSSWSSRGVTFDTDEEANISSNSGVYEANYHEKRGRRSQKRGLERLDDVLEGRKSSLMKSSGSATTDGRPLATTSPVLNSTLMDTIVSYPKALGMFLFVVFLLLTPLATAFFYQGSYLDERLKKIQHVKDVWRIYKPVHMMWEGLLNQLMVGRLLYVYTPEVPPLEHANAFQLALRSILNAFWDMLSKIWFTDESITTSKHLTQKTL